MNSWRSTFQRIPKTVSWLMGIQAALYLLMLMLFESPAATSLSNVVMLSPDRLVKGWVWQLVSYPLFHAARDVIGILVSLFALWSLGSLFGRRWRPTHFLFFFFVCAAGGGLAGSAAWFAAPGMFAPRISGAFPALMGLMTAYWMIFGKEWVRLMGTKPIQARWLFYAVVGLQCLFFVFGTNPDLAANLGGALTGWFLVTGRWRPGKMLKWLSQLWETLRRNRLKRRFRVVHRSLFPLHPLRGVQTDFVS